MAHYFQILEEKLTTQSTETFEDDKDEIEQIYVKCLACSKEVVSYCWKKIKVDPTKFHSWDLGQQDKSEHYCEKQECYGSWEGAKWSHQC